MFDVFINDGNHEVPNSDIFYIIGKDGIFLRKKLGRIDAIVPVKTISTLGKVEPSATYDLPQIPALMFSKVVSFFKKIYEIHRSEAIVLVHFNEDTEKYKLQVPHQKVTYGGIKYIRTVTFPGYTKVSTIHSHSSMSAFHSGTDDRDEKDNDGLHITIGSMDWPNNQFDLSTSIVFNGHRFMVNPDDYIEGLKNITVDEPQQYSWYESFHGANSIKSAKSGFIIDVPESKMTFDKRWLEYVTVESAVRRYSSLSMMQHYKTNQHTINNIFDKDYKFNLDDNDDASKFNPCENCVFSDYKLLQEIEDEDLEDEIDENEIISNGTEFNFRQITHPNQNKLIKGGE